MHRKVLVSAFLLAALTLPALGRHQGMYYATRSGKTYHKRDCKVIAGKTVYEVSWSDITKHKMTPCKKCKP